MGSENNGSSGESTNMHLHVLVLDLVRKAEGMLLKGSIDEGKMYLNEAKKMNNKLGDQHLEALILEKFGLYYQASDDYEKAMEKACEAIAIFRQLPGPTAREGNANALLILAIIHGKLGKHKEAIQYQEQAIEILLKMRNESPDVRLPGQRLSAEKSLADTYGNMGEAYMEIGEYKKGLELCQEGLKINRNIGDKRGEAINLHNVGNAHLF